MDCPRCRVELGAQEQGRLCCPDCAGAWVDGTQVADAYPALRHHARRIDELLDAGARRGRGIEICPDCGARSVEFPFLHVWLDLCPQCYGIWLDGPEVAVVSAAADDVDGLPDPAQLAGGYRAAAPSTCRLQCVACHRDVHPTRTFITADGVLCDDCVDLQERSEALQDAPILRRARTIVGKLFGGLWGALDADGRRVGRWPR